VWCVLATCRVDEGSSRSEQLVGYFYIGPLLDVAFCLEVYLLRLTADGRLDTARLTCLQRSQLIENTVKPSFFLPGIISLFIMCVGIITNNSLVGGRAWAESNPGH